MRTKRYYELAAKISKEMDESGIKLDLNCPCDRAILTEFGLTDKESFEFLSLFDAIECDNDEPTIRTEVPYVTGDRPNY